MTTLPDNPKLSRRFRLQWEEAQSGYVLLYPEGMIKLNQSAAEILKRCDGRRDFGEIVKDLEASFSTEGLENDVKEFLEQANERGWLV